MSETKYPLCARAKLHVFKIPLPDADLVSAADVEKLLEGAPVVYSGSLNIWDKGTEDDDTHSARLIMIEPIVKDTAESLLRDMVDHDTTKTFPWCDFIARARRLLEGK